VPSDFRMFAGRAATDSEITRTAAFTAGTDSALAGLTAIPDAVDGDPKSVTRDGSLREYDFLKRLKGFRLSNVRRLPTIEMQAAGEVEQAFAADGHAAANTNV
jgi:hypothetical protein